MDVMSPIVEGMNEEEEINYIIKELLSMQEEEKNMASNENQEDTSNRGILQIEGDKINIDCGKCNTNKRGRKSFLDEKNGWGSRGSNQNNHSI